MLRQLDAPKTRSAVRSVFLGLLLSAVTISSAAAQQFPQTLPANTVYGRLGIGAGPGQPVPITSLLSAAQQSPPNQVFAGGPSGTATTAASFRSLVPADLPQAPVFSLLGNPTGTPAAPSYLTLDPTLSFAGTTLKCALFASLQAGCVPASGGGTVNFLRADGTFATPPGAIPAFTNNRVGITGAAALSSGNCGSTIALGGGTFYTLTINAASGYTATCAFIIVNEDSGRGKKIAVNGTSSFILWPLQTAIVFNDNNVWQVSAPAQWTPPAAITLYIDLTGNDANDCLAAGTAACATSNGAVSAAAKHIFNANGITFQYDNGVYNQAPFVAQPIPGPGSITVQGNMASPGSTLLQVNASALNCLICIQNVPGVWNVQGLTLNSLLGSSNGNGLLAQTATVNFQNIIFGALPGGTHISALNNAHVENAGCYQIAGSAASHLASLDDSILHVTTGTTGCITFANSPAFSSGFAVVHGAGAIIGVTPSLFGSGWSNSGPSWGCTLLGLIDSGAPASIPGNGTGNTTANVLSGQGCYVN